MAELKAATQAAQAACEGPDLELLHKKITIDEAFEESMAKDWPENPCVDADIVFHADDSIVAAIKGLGEVCGSAQEDPEATATDELLEVLAEADKLFESADKDGDGMVDAGELKELVFDLYTKGGRYPPDLAQRVNEEVVNTMDRFDKDDSDCIDKSEFKRMLCSNPWKVLLPESARKNTGLMRHYFGIE